MGFLDRLWHHAANRVTQDVSHPTQGLSDLANLAYNVTGTHDLVDAAKDPTNWKQDLKAGAVLGGYILPGMLAGRAVGGIGADLLARYGTGALPGMTEVASDPANPQGYINTVLGAVPGAIPTPPLDHFVENTLGPSKQQAIAAAIAAKIASRSETHVPSYIAGSLIQ